jgi:hypothetical protein
MTGYPVWGFRKLAKDMDAVVLIADYTYTAPQMWGEKDRRSASTNVAPGMNMLDARAGFLNAKASGGTVILKQQLINSSEKVGELKRVEDEKTGIPGLSGFGAGPIRKTKGSYVLEVDRAAFEAGVLRGAAAFNEQIVAAFKAEQGK